MKTESLVTVGFVSFGAAGAGGIWLFLKELAYGSANPGSQLTGVLQVVGLVLVALAVGGLVAMTVLKRMVSARSDQGDPW